MALMCSLYLRQICVNYIWNIPFFYVDSHEIEVGIFFFFN